MKGSKNNNESNNAREWTDEKLLGKIKESERIYNKTTREFLKSFNETNYRSFEGERKERHWYYYTKILVERNKEKLKKAV